MSFFGTSFFYGKIGHENVFDHMLERKNSFLSSKNQKFKRSKNCLFSKGVNPWFWSKNDHFSNFFFLGKIGQENVFYDILERKNAFLGYKNKKFKESKNCHFSKRDNPCFRYKNGHFFNFFFLGKIGQENVFYDILERKNVFLGYKNKTLKKWKSWYFSKGFNPSFFDKNCLFCNFFLLGKIGLENVFYYILERKNAFLGSKKRSSKSRKIAIFAKGPMVFVQKWPFFQLLFFRQYIPRKCLLRYSRTKKRLSRQ